MSIDLFLSAVVGLFVIVDPVGGSAVFAALTKRDDRATQKRMAVKAVLLAIGLLIGFAFVGHTLLEHMGISLSAFRTAGGLLLFVTAFRMIMGFHDPDQLNSENSAYKDKSDIAVFPMAIPLLAGPGTMTATLMFATASKSMMDYGLVVLAIICVQAISLICLLGATRLSKMFGPTGNGIIARVMGILLAALAVQFIADGLHDLIQS